MASTDKSPLNRWAIDSREKASSWSADTLTSWMQLVLMEIKVNPPHGFAWIPHSL
jgi:hypothetical protein